MGVPEEPELSHVHYGGIFTLSFNSYKDAEAAMLRCTSERVNLLCGNAVSTFKGVGR